MTVTAAVFELGHRLSGAEKGKPEAEAAGNLHAACGLNPKA